MMFRAMESKPPMRQSLSEMSVGLAKISEVQVSAPLVI